MHNNRLFRKSTDKSFSTEGRKSGRFAASRFTSSSFFNKTIEFKTMDVCSKDLELDNIFWSSVGPKNESTLEAVRRCYRGLTSKITNPERRTFKDEQLEAPGWSTQHFQLRTSLNQNLHCVFWEKEIIGTWTDKEGAQDKEEKQGEGEGEGVEEEDGEQQKFERNEIVVVYMHTNTSCLADAIEVLPVCAALNACMVAYDLRGHGRSDGEGMVNISSNVRDLETVVAWARHKSNNMILWARGAATCVASRYQSLLCPKVAQNPKLDNPIKYMVLDSPFISVRQMYKDCVDKVREKNYEYVPETLFGAVAKYFRRGVKVKLGEDPFDISLEAELELCTSPASFLIAINDDYIPPTHGTSLAALYGGPIFARMFEGRHFTPRKEEIVTGVVAHVESRIAIEAS